MAVRITQETAEVLTSPDPSARLTQSAAEVLTQPTDQRARVTQVAVEILVAAPVPGFPVMAPGIWPGPFLTGLGRIQR